MARAWMSAIVTTCGIFFVGAFVRAPDPVFALLRQPVAAQLGLPAIPADSLIHWAIREGGAFVVILVILFFYRRDWATATEYWQSQNQIVTQLVINNTAATENMRAALAENTVVTHSLKALVTRLMEER